MEPVPDRCRRKGSPFALGDANESHRTAAASGISAFGLALAAATLATACTTLTVDPFPEPIRPPKEDPETAATTEGTTAGQEKAGQRGLTKSNIPGVVIQRTVAEGLIEQFGQDLTGDPIKVSFHEIPLVAFINAVFGEQLNMSFVVSPGLQNKKDLVTLRLTEPLPPAELFLWARRALNTYGVDTREEGGVLTFFESDEIASPDIPLLITGKALPEVPATHRTIFQLVPLRVAKPDFVSAWLRRAFQGQDLEIDLEPGRAALFLQGGADVIARAVDMMEVLDQPMLQGKNGVILHPRFVDVATLADELTTVMIHEGYDVGVGRTGNVTLLPLEASNKLVVFANDPAQLDHVEEWARILDAEHRDTVEEALFSYEVRNTQAEELTETLNNVLGQELRTTTGQPGSAAPGQQMPPTVIGVGRIVVDKNRNMILFRGSGKEWADVLQVVEKLDKPVPSVLIEVLIAEITLTDMEKSGIEFMLRGGVRGRDLSGGTLKALGVGAGGLSMALDSSGLTRALLNLFYEDNRVVIRSSPKLFVKSGGTATLEVGNEIPVITQISDEARQVAGSTNILQDVSYRKTGVSLEISPIVQANGLVDLEISQELSEAQPSANTSIAGSPTILSRHISTSLTLKDGGSLVMGGLIANNRSAGQTGIPALGQIPLLGRLFRSDTLQEDRTELLIMVIPYVVATHAEGSALTEELKQQLDLHRAFLR